MLHEFDDPVSRRVTIGHSDYEVMVLYILRDW
jgi:hypothetical protein